MELCDGLVHGHQNEHGVWSGYQAVAPLTLHQTCHDHLHRSLLVQQTILMGIICYNSCCLFILYFAVQSTRLASTKIEGQVV